ncbi:family 78 glycoside hydrolase catalytic domain [Demequina sp. SYSU T00192]|uniref:alpha-L-rhamnosidase n=1 Tax=Demequina litoralis TaxID=3051660 RepID=A0ABT8GCE2_9MICO|nr:alpha-L-rhamnosidase [Demequina sp. SYSU T00192]MDN4476808.1 family 78 glycoside hydrolase catalytic domain [Demequina sp. SYSU T00192]
MTRTTPSPALTHLRVDHLDSPLALSRNSPGFAWRIEAGAREGVAQSSYRIVLTDLDGAVAADTGTVASDACVAVEVPGFAGRRGAAYSWSVEATLTDGTVLTAASSFGIAHDGWKAPWIEPAQERVVAEGPTNPRPDLVAASVEKVAGVPLAERLHPPRRLRHAFTLPRAPRRAILRITSQGIHQASLNGARVDDALFGPGYESYELSMPVVSHDVTALLREGDNVLGVELADGWWAGRISFLGRSAQYGDTLRASWQLELEHADGTNTTLIPDAAEVASARGPIDWSDLFIGERRDARLDEPGWDAPGFSPAVADAWTPCTAVAFDSPIHPFHGEPVRRAMEVPAQRVWTAPNGDLLVDFGQVLAGRVRFRVEGERGTTVRLEHAEVLGPDGNLVLNVTGFAKDQADEYVLAGVPGGESWEPDYTFHGFRYVRLIGWPGTPAPADLTAVVIASDLEQTAALETSDPRLDQLFRNTVWSQRSNFLAVPTDCPQRERAGYTGDLQIFAETASTLMGVAAFLERWLADVRRDQDRRDGGVSAIVPEPPAMGGDFGAGTIFGEIRTPAGWADAITIAPWALYRHYGDPRFLADNLDAMRTWVEFQTAQAASIQPAWLADAAPTPEREARHALLWNGSLHFGDWLTPSTMVGFDEHPGDAILRAPVQTSEIVGPVFQVCSLQLLARAEAELGNHERAAALEARLAAVRAAFAAEYIGPDGEMTPDLQGMYVLALAFDMAPEALRPRLVERLVTLVHGAGDHLDTGFLSVPYLLDVLWDHGERDLARRLLVQDTVPSWLYEVEMGATTIWEAWRAVHEDGTVEEMSMNHYAFGCVVDWIIRRQAGIELIAPGYRRSRIAPDLDGDLTRSRAHVDTPYGRLAVAWERDDARSTVTVEVPVGVTAEVELPPTWRTDAPTALRHGTHVLTATHA